MPLAGQLGSAAEGLVPDDGEVCATAEVLRDSYGGVQV